MLETWDLQGTWITHNCCLLWMWICGKPTYWPFDPKKTLDLTDFFFVKNISSNSIKIENAFDMNSDHSSIYLTIGDKSLWKIEKVTLINKYTDSDYFNQLLENGINLPVPLKTTEQLEEEWNAFTCSPVIKRNLQVLKLGLAGWGYLTQF